MRFTRFFTALILILLVFQGRAFSDVTKLSRGLRTELGGSAQDKLIPIMAGFRNPIPGRQLLKEVEGMNHVQQRAYVIERVKSNYFEEAGDVLDWIQAEQDAGRAKHGRDCWISHGYVVSLRADRIEELAAFDAVRTIGFDQPIPIEQVIDEGPRDTNEIDDTPWGVEYVNAPEFWAMGFKGRESLVAMIDTGVDSDHEELVDRLWINPGEIPENGIDDDENGFIDDIHGWNFYDDNGNIEDTYSSYHGTKCAGVICGDGTNWNDTTGIAIEGTLIVIRNHSTGWSSEATHTLAVQYAVENGARVISCSMSYPYDPDDPDYPGYVNHRTAQEVSLAAGVMQANSVNNYSHGGPPHDINCPANCPPPWLHPDQTLIGGVSAIIGCGAHTSAGAQTTYSQEGPTEWFREDFPENFRDYPYQDGEFMGLMKPDLLVPGSAYTTSGRGGHSNFNGTSASTPHMGGALTILRSIHQQATPEEITEAIMMTADDRGDPGFDNQYGAGNLQPIPAHEYLDNMFDYGGLEVTVLDNGGFPVIDALVDLDDGVVLKWSNMSGVALNERILPGTYSMTVTAEGHETVTIENVSIETDTITELTVVLTNVTIEVEPIYINTELATDDTLDVPFVLSNSSDSPVTYSIALEPYSGYDWEADLTFNPADTIGFIEARGMVTLDSIFIVAGQHPTGDPMFWRFSENGELIDSLAQPGEFGDDGVRDMASMDGLVFAGIGAMLYTLNSDLQVVDSLDTGMPSISGVAVDAVANEFYLNGMGTDIFRFASDGTLIETFDIDFSPVGLAYHPDDRYGPALYSLILAGAGMAELHRINLDTGDDITIADLAQNGTDIAVALDINSYLSAPVHQIVSYQLASGLNFFKREPNPSAFNFPVEIEVPVGSTTVPFSAFGPFGRLGHLARMELVWNNIDQEITYRMPVTINYVEEVSIADEKPLPTEHVLFNAWPNPFNPEVNLQFEIDRMSDAKLSIYNLLGQEVAVLHEQVSPAGQYKQVWDASNLAAGVYFAVLRTNQDVHIQKLLLLK